MTKIRPTDYVLKSGSFAGLIAIWSFSFCSLARASEPLDPARSITWQGNTGVVWQGSTGIPDTTQWPVSATLNPSGGDDAVQIRNALSNAQPGRVVKLNPGTFRISSPIDYQNIGPGRVLKGSGTGLTTLQFDNGFPAAFHVRGFLQYKNTQVLLSANATKGSNTVTVASVPTWATVGRLYFISQLDDPTYVSHVSVENPNQHGAWYYVGGEERSMGQLNKLVSKTSTTMTFELPMYWAYSTTFSAAVNEAPYSVSSAIPVNEGFEDFTMVGGFADGDTFMFKFENADSCWVKNVNITNQVGRNAIHTDFSYRLGVEHCYIKDSHVYGAGQGYGIAFYNLTTACLIQNNIFEHLHIGMEMNYTAQGHVVAYNLFLPGYADSGASPSISMHGVHSWMNLFEGNYCREYFGADITHGSSSHSTLFRNKIINDGPSSTLGNSSAIYFQQYNRYGNVIGNILGKSGFHNGYDRAISGAAYSCGDGHKTIYDIGCGLSPEDSVAVNQIQRSLNYDYFNNAIVPGGFVIGDLRNSYYLSSAPTWFGSLSWPPFNPANPNAAAVVSIPAGYRYVNGVDPGGTPAPPPPATPSPSGTPQPTPTPTATATPAGTPTATPGGTPLGTSFESTQGVITSPFVISGNTISQPILTTDPTQGGRAAYTFSVSTAGDYLLSANVNCADGGSNSFFVNIDAEPTSAMEWDIPVTSGFEIRVASWSPSTTPKAWTLSAGTHQLIIRGREANAILGHINLGIPPNAPQGLHVVP